MTSMGFCAVGFKVLLPVTLLSGVLAAADSCEAAKEVVRNYLSLIASLSKNGFSNEAQMKSLKDLTEPRLANSPLGYFVYSSQEMESCEVDKNGQARVRVQYSVIGHVTRQASAPARLPQLEKISGRRVLYLRVVQGKVRESADDPFYPRIVAIQDYEERLGRKQTTIERARAKNDLEFLKQQK